MTGLLHRLYQASLTETPAPQRFSPPATLAALRDRLFAQADPLVYASNPKAGLYVLVSPYPEDPLADAPRRAEAIPIPLPARVMEEAHRPYLLPLGDFGRDDTIDTSLDRGWADATRAGGGARGIVTTCAWLVLPMDDVQFIAHRLQDSWCRALTGLPARAYRYWDPRVLALVAEELPPALLHDVTGGAAGWWWLDRQGELQSRPPIPRASAPIDDHLPERAARLLRHAARINQTLNMLQDSGGPHDDTVRRQLLPLVERAEETWGMRDESDIARFALYGVLISPQFDDAGHYPEANAAMHAALDQGTSPLEALTQFSQEYWEGRQRV